MASVHTPAASSGASTHTAGTGADADAAVSDRIVDSPTMLEDVDNELRVHHLSMDLDGLLMAYFAELEALHAARQQLHAVLAKVHTPRRIYTHTHSASHNIHLGAATHIFTGSHGICSGTL